MDKAKLRAALGCDERPLVVCSVGGTAVGAGLNVPRLYEHYAACDAAVVQGGGMTTLELTALRRPR